MSPNVCIIPFFINSSDVALDNAETGKKKKKPRKVLMCSDGLYEEYSTGIDRITVKIVKKTLYLPGAKFCRSTL